MAFFRCSVLQFFFSTLPIQPPLNKTYEVLRGYKGPFHVNKGDHHFFGFNSKLIQSSRCDGNNLFFEWRISSKTWSCRCSRRYYVDKYAMHLVNTKTCRFFS
eukprot:Gb_31567 [translate_table: standard]